MAHLEDVKKTLFGKEKEDTEAIEKRLKWRMFFPRPRRSVPVTWVGQERLPEPEKRRRKFLAPLFITLITVLILVSIGLFVFLYIGSRGQEVRLAIQASARTESGAILTIPVVVRNVSREILTDGEVVLTVPSGSLIRQDGRDAAAPARIVRRVKDLLPEQTEVVEFEVRLFGSEGEKREVEAAYLYRPESMRARFTARAGQTIEIASVPLSLSWEFPETLTRGQDVAITVRYLLQSKSPFRDVAFQILYPPGFSFKSADPAPTLGETLWVLGTLEPHREGVIVIRGSISGEEGEVKAFRGSLGAYNTLTNEWAPYVESTRDLTIAVSPLFVEGSYAGSRDAILSHGSTINFAIRYKNNTPAAIKNVTVRAWVEGIGIDPARIQPANEGVVEFGTGAIIWGPGNVIGLREVAPGQGGTLGFSSYLRTPPLMRSEADKEQTVKLHTVIEAATFPVSLQGTKLTGEDVVEFKTGTVTSFAANVFYNSPIIPNTGPIPPRAGEKTTYTIHWEVRNYTNDLADVEVRSRLATNVAWEEALQTQGNPISYDSASGVVRWRIGRVGAGTGVITPALIGAFQVSIIPSAVDEQRRLVLVQESEFIARDTFVNEAIKQKASALSALHVIETP